jgi:hypothetical protein
MNIYDIKGAVESKGSHFFDRDAMKFFSDRLCDFRTREIDWEQYFYKNVPVWTPEYIPNWDYPPFMRAWKYDIESKKISTVEKDSDIFNLIYSANLNHK